MTSTFVADVGAFGYVLRRPEPERQSPLPLGARSVCHARFNAGQYEDKQVRHFTKGLWCVSGKARVLVAGREQTLAADQLAILLPDTEHRAYALEGSWELRWWTMNGSSVPLILSGLGFPGAGIYHVGPAPIDTFARLKAAIQNMTRDGALLAEAAAYALLCQAATRRQGPAPDPVVEKMMDLLRRGWASPELSIKSLATALRQHRSSLCRRFHRATGMSPQSYLCSVRLQNALAMLETTQLSVKEISHRCGFADANYFARFFRKTIGVSPRECRQTPNAGYRPQPKKISNR